jgi:hypothetical protein
MASTSRQKIAAASGAFSGSGISTVPSWQDGEDHAPVSSDDHQRVLGVGDGWSPSTSSPQLGQLAHGSSTSS